MAGLTGRVARPGWFGLPAAQHPEVDSRKFAAGRHEDASWEGALEQRPAPVKKDGAKLRGQRHVGSNGGSARGSENHRQNAGNRERGILRRALKSQERCRSWRNAGPCQVMQGLLRIAERRAKERPRRMIRRNQRESVRLQRQSNGRRCERTRDTRSVKPQGCNLP